MTPEEWAEKITFEIDWPDINTKDVEFIKQTIKAAVKAEREECAKILDSADAEPYCSFHISELARQIRARSNTAE